MIIIRARCIVWSFARGRCEVHCSCDVVASFDWFVCTGDMRRRHRRNNSIAPLCWDGMPSSLAIDCDIASITFRCTRPPSWIFKTRNFWRSTVIAVKILQNRNKILRKSYEQLRSYRYKRCFAIWRPFAIFSFKKFEFWSTHFDFYCHSLIQCVKFRHNRIIFTEIYRYNDDFHVSGCPRSWICDDVTILHPVIESQTLS